jgi:hypothetical protein
MSANADDLPETSWLLAAERARSTFDEVTMTDLLNGGRVQTDYRKEIMEEIDRLVAVAEGPQGHDSSAVAASDNSGAADGDDDDDELAAGAMPNEDHSMEEARLQTMKMLRFQFNQLMQDAAVSVKKRQARIELMSLYDPSWFTKNGVHFGLFMGALQGQGSPQQLAKWMPLTLTFQVCACGCACVCVRGGGGGGWVACD